jgi:hypothetical protein
MLEDLIGKLFVLDGCVDMYIGNLMLTIRFFWLDKVELFVLIRLLA